MFVLRPPTHVTGRGKKKNGALPVCQSDFSPHWLETENDVNQLAWVRQLQKRKSLAMGFKAKGTKKSFGFLKIPLAF